MSDFDTTVRALRRWMATHDLHVRAAVELLIWHEHWLRRQDFRKASLHDDTAVDGSMWIHWRQAREFFDSGPRGSSSELAILGDAHSRAIVRAVAQALGEER